MKYLKYIKSFNKINENKRDNFLDWIPFSKGKRPASDLDIKLNKNLIRESVRKFDIMFGTDYFDKFGMDYHILTGSNIYYAKEVIESLTDEALRSSVYDKFDLVSKKDESQNFLYDYIMSMSIKSSEGCGEDCFDDTLYFLKRNIPLKVSRGEFLYKFFKKFGSEFNNDLIKDIFEVKNGYDLGGNGNQMEIKIQKAFLTSTKRVLDKFEKKGNKGVSKVIDTQYMFKLILEDFCENEFINDESIKEKYLKKRLNDWFKWIKNNLIG